MVNREFVPISFSSHLFAKVKSFWPNVRLSFNFFGTLFPRFLQHEVSLFSKLAVKRKAQRYKLAGLFFPSSRYWKFESWTRQWKLGVRLKAFKMVTRTFVWSPFPFSGNRSFSQIQRLLYHGGWRVWQERKWMKVFAFFCRKFCRKFRRQVREDIFFLPFLYSAVLSISFSIVTFAGKPSFHILFFDTTERYFYRKRITNGSETE